MTRERPLDLKAACCVIRELRGAVGLIQGQLTTSFATFRDEGGRAEFGDLRPDEL